LAIGMISCREDYTGFTELESGVYRKLHTFGECTGDLGSADFSGLNIYLSKADQYDSIQYFELFNGKLGQVEKGSNPIDTSLYQELRKVGCGDSVSFIVPYAAFDSTFLDQYRGGLYRPDEKIRITVRVRNIFDRMSFLEYASVMSQQGKMDEKYMLQFALMNGPTEIEKHGDVYVERLEPATGDTLRKGDEVSIEYNTYLLDGTPIDSLTTMQFPFGRPGQLLPGFQFGLSLLCEGEKARIYMPSYLAFGEKGSSSGLIPPKTPLCFEVRIASIHRKQGPA